MGRWQGVTRAGQGEAIWCLHCEFVRPPGTRCPCGAGPWDGWPLRLSEYVGVEVRQYSPLFMIGRQVAPWPLRAPYRWHQQEL